MSAMNHIRPRRHPTVSFLAGALIFGATFALFCGKAGAAPTIQAIYPVRGADVEGVVNLRVFSYEGAVVTQTALIDTVKFFRKAAPTSFIQLVRIANTGEWSGVWNASSLPAGADTLVFRAINNTGVTQTDSTVVVNIVNTGSTTPPTVEITAPQAGATLSGTYSVTFTATAGSGTLSTREISVDGATYTPTSSATSHSLNTASMADGSHTLRIRVTNNNGASTESRITTVFIRNAPSISWTSPSGGSRVGGRLILNYAGSTIAPSSMASESLFVDGTFSKTLHTPSGPDTLDINGLGEGTHGFQIKATDDAGKATWSQSVNLLVANGPWSVLLGPAGIQTLSGRVALSWQDSVTALTTVSTDSLQVDGKSYLGLSTSGADSLNTTDLPDGEHTLRIQVSDSHGRRGYSQSVTVLLRNGPTVLIDSALADSTVSGTLVVRFSITPVAPASVATRQISIDGGAFLTTNGTASDTLDTRSLSEGGHTAQIRGVDSQGKEGLSRQVKFNVRNAPKVSITAPAVDAFVKGTITVAFYATAVFPDTLKATQISIGGGDWIATSTDSTHSLDTRNYKDGDLRIQVRAIDGNGKSAQTLARECVVDNSPPKISYPEVAYPENAPTARQGISVAVTAQGLDLGSGMSADSAMTLSIPLFSLEALLLKDDGKNGDKVAGDNVFSATLSIDSKTTGLVPFSIRARDALGNDSTVSGGLTLDNTEPVLTLSLEPSPGKIAGSLEGEVYVPRILAKGGFSDAGGSGMKSVLLVVRNDSASHVNNSPELIPLLDGSFRRIVELVPGRNRISLIGADQAGNADTVSATVTYIVPKETRLITGAGGVVLAPDGSGVVVPPGSLDASREITVTLVDAKSEPKPLDRKINLLGVPHEFGPDGQIFPQPVTITLAYTDADMDRNQDGISDFKEDKLTIVFWNGSSWIKAGDAKLDKAHKTLSVKVNHFTLFDIAEDLSEAPSEVLGFWDRNPVPGNAEFIYKVPVPGKLSLFILDLSGDVVNMLIPPDTHVAGGGSVRWNGGNVRGHFSGAGLYVYVFKFVSDDGKLNKLVRKPVGLVGK
ncbi:MAG: Ig-like domain-containing protein [Fibrobacteria bacterium]